MYNGLFPEDAQEATGVTRDEAVTPALGPWANYDSKSVGISKYLSVFSLEYTRRLRRVRNAAPQPISFSVSPF